jgi:flavin reductase (DIM6/NTAB) family NADH-FMN oxidoreductase RutF
MDLHVIDPFKFSVSPHYLFDRQMVLLTSGDFANGDFNCMTIGWGLFGTMWSVPAALVVVRPSRFTFEFMERFDNFTMTAFPREFKRDVVYLGRHSGRDEDKLSKTQLSAVAADLVSSPTFAEAELSVECKKIYYSDYTPDHFLAPFIHKQYDGGDYHRLYYGEILQIKGIDKYQTKTER